MIDNRTVREITGGGTYITTVYLIKLKREHMRQYRLYCRVSSSREGGGGGAESLLGFGKVAERRKDPSPSLDIDSVLTTSTSSSSLRKLRANHACIM